MLLRESPRRVCLACHETVRRKTETAVSRHDRGCTTCHDPHASDESGLLPTDPTTLCLGCHDREIELSEGGELSNVKMEIESGTHLHGPVSDGDCAACHANHGSEHFRLLNEEYPADFYTSFSEERYALCFTCHDDRLVLVPSTTTLTGFRNGDLNLHFVHVNREKKGRTCRVCHDVHAGTNQNLVRESVPFGRVGYRLTIGHEPTANGGRCATGCHKPHEYDRNLQLDAPTTDAAAPSS
jgi:predicted CXXCH cytochrome family protein